MMRTLVWLVDPKGRVSRGQYLASGLLLLLWKIAIDAAICRWLLDRSWSPDFYLTPFDWRAFDGGQSWSWWLLGLVAVPFAWIGTTLSVRRLRDAGLSPWFVAVFVLPFANLVLFVLLSALGSVPEGGTAAGTAVVESRSARPFWSRVGVPAFAASLVTAALVWISIVWLPFFGGTLFLAIPFLQGLLVGLMVGHRGFGQASGEFVVSTFCSMALLLVAGHEGLLCIFMAAPIWIGMGLIGSSLGCVLRSNSWQHVAPAVLVVPMAQWLEPHVQPEPAVFEATTSVAVAAPPAVVWKHLVAFSELPPPTELPFRLGIAYPVRASIEGQGVGAVRRCSFSTGDFVEPIEVWDEPRLLRFSVQECPQPMVEWNPFHDHVDAAHLHGSFTARRGQFALHEQPDGSTVLAGTTWYSHGLWPEAYWAWWSDAIVHTIHRRVLAHIGRCAEGDGR